MAEFSSFVVERYGGMIFRLFKLDKSNVEKLEEKIHDPTQVSGTETVARVLELTHEQMSHSYVVDLEVPNPRQDGARHDLVFKARRVPDARGSRLAGWNLAYMPYYTSSRPVRQRLASYLGSPFKKLRLLSAYELRNHWSDPELYGAWRGRWQAEGDAQVRGVLFETWVAINLKRLQASRDKDAYANLTGLRDRAYRLPDPMLAREAARLAQRYRLHTSP